MNTVIDFLEKSKQKWPNKIAITQGDRVISFKDFVSQSIKRSNTLISLGIKPGDRIGVCMQKSIDQAIIIYAILLSNAILVPILPKLKPNSIKHIINDCNMSLIITDKARESEINLFFNQSRIIIGAGEDNYFDHISQNLVEFEVYHFNRISTDLAAIIYSSGSTGMPKGIKIPHRSIHDGALIVADFLNTNHNEHIAGVLSLNFDYGLNQLWQTFLVGATLHLHEFIFVNDFFNFLYKQKISMLPLMPVLISHFTKFKENQNLDKFSVLKISSTGGALSQQMIDGLSYLFPKAKIFSMFGLTEAFRSTFLDPNFIKTKPKSIGKAIPDVEILILDENNNHCKPGQHGELVHRGACVTLGYWNNEEKTREKFKKIKEFGEEVLVFSGDIVKKDEDGFIYFVGRKDEMIKTHGFRVSPFEVESILNQNKLITSCVAFGINDKEIGNKIILSYCSINSKPISEIDLKLYCKKNLASYMVPSSFVFLSSMPTTGNQGKIDRMSVKSISLEKLELVYNKE